MSNEQDRLIHDYASIMSNEHDRLVVINDKNHPLARINQLLKSGNKRLISSMYICTYLTKHL